MKKMLPLVPEVPEIYVKGAFEVTREFFLLSTLAVDSKKLL